jgi:hypothetical protein
MSADLKSPSNSKLSREEARKFLIRLIDSNYIGKVDDKVIAMTLERRIPGHSTSYSMHVDVDLANSLPKKCRHW